MSQNIKILNPSSEKLDTLVEGNESSNITIVLAHGFGTDKHETAGQFDDIAVALTDKYRVLRFDFSGFGKSEGNTEDFDFNKSSTDLNSVLDFVRHTYSGEIFIIAQSMGCFITTLLNPKDIRKTILMGTPNSDTEYIIDRLSKRYLSKQGAVLNYEGISLIPRTSGAINKIGPTFWTVLKNFRPVQKVQEFSKNTNLLIIHPLQDDVVGLDYQKEYDAIPGIKIEWINGDHSFKKREDRKVLIEKIKQFFA